MNIDKTLEAIKTLNTWRNMLPSDVADAVNVLAANHDALAAEVKQLREFVGAMEAVELNGFYIVYQDGEWWVFRSDGEGIASGTDPFEAWCKSLDKSR